MLSTWMTSYYLVEIGEQRTVALMAGLSELAATILNSFCIISVLYYISDTDKVEPRMLIGPKTWVSWYASLPMLGCPVSHTSTSAPLRVTGCWLAAALFAVLAARAPGPTSPPRYTGFVCPPAAFPRLRGVGWFDLLYWPWACSALLCLPTLSPLRLFSAVQFGLSAPGMIMQSDILQQSLNLGLGFLRHSVRFHNSFTDALHAVFGLCLGLLCCIICKMAFVRGTTMFFIFIVNKWIKK